MSIFTSIKNFFKNAFGDMKDSARAQHEVDRANFQAAKAEARADFEENRGSVTFQRAKTESRAQFEEARAMRDPAKRKEILQAQRDEQIARAQERTEAAQARVDAAKGSKK